MVKLCVGATHGRDWVYAATAIIRGHGPLLRQDGNFIPQLGGNPLPPK